MSWVLQCVDCCSEQDTALPVRAAGLRRKGALVADGELQRIMAHVDLDGNNTLDFQVRAAARGCAGCSHAACLHDHKERRTEA